MEVIHILVKYLSVEEMVLIWFSTGYNRNSGWNVKCFNSFGKIWQKSEVIKEGEEKRPSCLVKHLFRINGVIHKLGYLRRCSCCRNKSGQIILLFAVECLLLMKPVWFMCIDNEITDSGLTDKSLLIIFVSVFSGDMGNNWSNWWEYQCHIMDYCFILATFMISL